MQVTLYDVAYKQFFGRTWVGPTISMKPHSQPFKLHYDQVSWVRVVAKVPDYFVEKLLLDPMFKLE